MPVSFPLLLIGMSDLMNGWKDDGSLIRTYWRIQNLVRTDDSYKLPSTTYQRIDHTWYGLMIHTNYGVRRISHNTSWFVQSSKYDEENDKPGAARRPDVRWNQIRSTKATTMRCIIQDTKGEGGDDLTAGRTKRGKRERIDDPTCASKEASNGNKYTTIKRTAEDRNLNKIFNKIW